MHGARRLVHCVSRLFELRTPARREFRRSEWQLRQPERRRSDEQGRRIRRRRLICGRFECGWLRRGWLWRFRHGRLRHGRFGCGRLRHGWWRGRSWLGRHFGERGQRWARFGLHDIRRHRDDHTLLQLCQRFSQPMHRRRLQLRSGKQPRSQNLHLSEWALFRRPRLRRLGRVRAERALRSSGFAAHAHVFAKSAD